MKGLKIIPVFLILMLLSYFGVVFVEANHEPVTIAFGDHKTETMAMGFVVLTSILVGMILAGLLCSVELLALFIQNKKLKRKLELAQRSLARPTTTPPPTDLAPGDRVVL